MKEFPNKYQHSEIEKKWQISWQESALYKWDESKSREENFVIDTPTANCFWQVAYGAYI